MNKKFSAVEWEPPDNWHRITTVDAHTGGEPLRVILDGYPALSGETLLERRNFAKRNHDDLRKALMLEPRGHADMYGCVITEPVSSDADFGVLFMHNEGYSTM
jgi:trans-L-3-hydroxyproline dehydratase